MQLRKIVSLFLVVLLAIGWVGCAKQPSEQESGKEAPSSGTTGGVIEEGATIVRTTEDWPTYYDPAVGSDYSDSITMCNVYDALVFPMPDGGIRPHVAKEWTVSDDHLTYTFKIRDDVKFHSGNLMKAGDVVYSMKRMLEIGEGYSYLYKGVVEDCYATDDYTVVFELSQPFGPFIYSLIRFLIVEEALVKQHYDLSDPQYGPEKGDYGKKWLLTNDAGSGPYKTKEFKLDEYFLGERFDDYFLGWDENAPKYFMISGMVEPVAVRTAMANMELEITDEIQPLENYLAMDEFPNVDLVTWESGNTFNMMMNTKAKYTDDVNLRKAIAYCFDYETLRTSIYPGAGESRGPVARVLPGFDPTVPAYYQDMAKAKEYLAKSKYAGEEITLNLTWCAEVPEQEKIALLLQSNLAELGIDLVITKKPFGAMIADAQTVETTPQISFVNFSAPYFEAGGMLKTRYHSSSCGTWEQMEWLQDPVLDQMIDDALATVDDEERFAKYAEIQHYIYDLCPTVWGFNWVERRAYQTYVRWNAIDAMKEGKEYFMPMGYALWAHDMKIIK